MKDLIQASSRPRPHKYVAVIGDMVGSRLLPAAERPSIQRRFTELIDSLNYAEPYQSTILSKFVITIGDEFQAILSAPDAIPDLIWELTESPGMPAFRLGFGCGAIDTDLPEYAINLDGPALHNARAAVDRAKSEALLGGVFCGFGEDCDESANGIARLLWFHRQRRTPSQLEVLGLLRDGHSQTAIAQFIGSSRQAVSDHARAAGWEAWKAGEAAFRAILRISTHTTSKDDASKLRPRLSRPRMA